MILKYIALVCAFNLLLSALLVVSMPVLIKQTLGLGDTWYGANQTAMAAGSLAGGLAAGLLGLVQCDGLCRKQFRDSHSVLLSLFPSIS